MPQTAAPVAAKTAWVGPTGGGLGRPESPVETVDQGWNLLELLSSDLVAHAHPYGGPGSILPNADYVHSVLMRGW